jgi:hypothetical protein
MRVECPYRCDYCLNLKGQTNNWWLRPVQADVFILRHWDDLLADQDGFDHICSESCASKALSKWVGQASGNVVTKAKPLPSPPGSLHEDLLDAGLDLYCNACRTRMTKDAFAAESQCPICGNANVIHLYAGDADTGLLTTEGTDGR